MHYDYEAVPKHERNMCDYRNRKFWLGLYYASDMGPDNSMLMWASETHKEIDTDLYI